MKNLKLAQRDTRLRTVITISNVELGRGFTVIAGPCSVESEEQIIESARAVKAAGADMLRGGAFKPRTSPYAFQGLGLYGLKLLSQAGKETGLPIVTEVIDPRDVSWVAEFVDVLQIGTRNMQNFSLLKEVGQTGRPILLTSHGRGVAVVQGLDEYEAAQEERDFMRAVVAGLADIEAGRVMPLDEAVRSLGLE